MSQLKISTNILNIRKGVDLETFLACMDGGKSHASIKWLHSLGWRSGVVAEQRPSVTGIIPSYFGRARLELQTNLREV